MNKTVVLLSGGMDSLLALAYVHQAGDEIYCLHMHYQQRTAEREKKAFNEICDHYKIPKERRKIIDMSFLSQIGGSSLTDKKIDVKNFDQNNQGIPDTYVPFRNSIILSLAVSWAEVLGADSLVMGANEQDSPGYPDCRQSYFHAFNQMAKLGTKEGSISIKTPVIKKNKGEIVSELLKLNAPVELSWSCYKELVRACGECESCVLRLKGFEIAGSEDPIAYH